jgi:hypothetical protein
MHGSILKEKKYLIKYILLAGIISFFGMGYVVLVPIYAKNILVGNIKTLGTLMSASGLGALNWRIVGFFNKSVYTKN